MIWIVVAVALVVVAVAVLVVSVGATLSKEHHASRMAHFNRSPQEVWEAISDFAEQAAWRSDLRRVKRLPDRNGRPVWEETDNRGQSLMMETVESRPPRRLVRRIANERLPFSGSWTMEIAEYGEVTSLTITEDGEVYNPVFRFVSRFIIGHAATIDKYLRDLGSKLGVDVTITGV